MSVFETMFAVVVGGLIGLVITRSFLDTPEERAETEHQWEINARQREERWETRCCSAERMSTPLDATNCTNFILLGKCKK